jgi:DDE family transposase
MSRAMTVQECDQAVCDLLPALPRPEQKALAALVSGVVLEQEAALSRASAGIPGDAQDRSKQRRAQRLLANPRLDVGRAQRRLLERVLRGRRGRLDLLLDATTTGATTRHAGTVSLVLAVGWHGRALPLVWRTWTADVPGQHWVEAIGQMCHLIQNALPADVQVLLLAARGLTGAPLAHLAQSLGWHYVWRVQGQTRVCHLGGSVRPIAALAPAPGTQCCLTAVRVWAPRRKGARWVSYWDEATVANVVALWRPADKEPWLLVTDLPASPARCRDYRRRTWEEELFRDLKSFGWQWQRSRVRRPERVERLLLVLALATLWVTCLAQRVLRRGWRPALEERSRRCYSRFQLGLRWITRSLANDLPVHCTFRLWAEAPAPLKLS